MLTARRQTKSNKGKNALTINEGIMAARPERVAISPLGVTCKGGLGKNYGILALIRSEPRLPASPPCRGFTIPDAPPAPRRARWIYWI